MKGLLKKILAMPLAFVFIFGTMGFIISAQPAQALDGRPGFTITGADEPLLNGLYAAGTDVEGKAAYLGPNGHAALQWVSANSRWELAYDAALKYYSPSVLNDPLPPADGWLRADDSADADFALRYGPTFSFQSVTADVDEATGMLDILVAPTDFPLPSSVQYATADGSAHAGADYTAQSGTLSFAGGAAPAAIHIPILEDNIYEGAETFTVTLSGPSAGAAIGNGTCTVTIADNDTLPVIGFVSAQASALENAGTVELAVTLSGPSAFDATVDYATSDGTAQAGQDYSANSGTLDIPAGKTFGTVSVALTDDSLYEGGEDFTVALSNPSGAAMGTPSVTVSLADDEALPIVGFRDAAITQGEAAGSVSLTVDLSAVSGLGTSVHYATADGTAKAGQDYTAASGTLELPAGETSGTIAVELLNDALHETDETFTVALTDPSGAALGTASATVTITDDDPAPTVGFDAASINVNESDAEAVFTVSLSAVSGMDTSVQYATADGAAKAGLDYVAASGTAIIPAGSDSATISVPIVNDSVHEAGEDFGIALSNPTGAALGNGTATAVIVDNDPLPTVFLDPASASANENGGSAALTGKLSNASSADVTVKYATADGTAKAGTDYTAKTGTLTIPAGSLSAQVQVTLLDDAVRNGDRQFTVTLSEPSGALLSAGASAAVTVKDNEAAPKVGFSASSKSVREDDDEVILTVKLSVASSTPVTVHYVTNDGTALADEDYLPDEGSLTIPAGQTSGTISISVYDDSGYGGSRKFTVTLSEPSGAALGTAKITVTILDDEPAPTPKPTATPTPSPSPTPSPAPSATATASPTPSQSPLPTGSDGKPAAQVPGSALSLLTQSDPETGGPMTVATIDGNALDSVVSGAVAAGAQGSTLTLPDVPQGQESKARLLAPAAPLQKAAGAGMGLSVKIRNVMFSIPAEVLRQIPANAATIALECGDAAGQAPSLKFPGFGVNQLALPLRFTLSYEGPDGVAKALSQFAAPVMVAAQLTEDQARLVSDPRNVKMCRYDTEAGQAEALETQYDAGTRTLSFSADRFSVFVPIELTPASGGIAWYWWALIILVCLGFSAAAVWFVMTKFKRYW